MSRLSTDALVRTVQIVISFEVRIPSVGTQRIKPESVILIEIGALSDKEYVKISLSGSSTSIWYWYSISSTALRIGVLIISNGSSTFKISI